MSPLLGLGRVPLEEKAVADRQQRWAEEHADEAEGENTAAALTLRTIEAILGTMIQLGIVAIALALVTTAAEAKVFECVISEKYVCDSGRGCGQVHNDIVVKLDLTRQTYSRCDSKGCDTFDVRLSQSGAFAVIDVPGRGMLAKFSDDGSGFVEVATIETQVLISFGSCK